MFHCGWDRLVGYPDKHDPNFNADKLGYKLHLNVGIYNPTIFGTAVLNPENYDFVVSNPDSRDKYKDYKW